MGTGAEIERDGLELGFGLDMGGYLVKNRISRGGGV